MLNGPCPRDERCRGQAGARAHLRLCRLGLHKALQRLLDEAAPKAECRLLSQVLAGIDGMRPGSMTYV
jgi:hypothetical protein